MLYGEFKKRFNSDDDEFSGEYKIEDARGVSLEKKEDKLKSKSKGKKIANFLCVLLLVAVVIFSATLLYFDLFDDQGINGLFTCFSQKVDFVYCISGGEFATIEEATALSDNLKAKGCAGYVYYNGKFNVLLSFYLDENSAKSVSQKTNYQIVKIYKASELKNVPSTIKGQYDKCKNFEEEVLSVLYEASVSLQNDRDSDKCKKTINDLITSQTEKVNPFLDSSAKMNNLDVQKYASKISSSINQLSKLQADPSLSNLRFTAIYISFVMT